MAQGLIDADHSKLPCLVPNSFKVTLNFDVVRKATGDLGTRFRPWARLIAHAH